MPDDKTQQQEPDKAKIVLVGLKEERNRYDVGKVLANQLGVTYEEAAELIEDLPAELIPSIPVEAGEKFADKLREVGAEIEVLPISRAAGHFCDDHPHRRARAKCKNPACEKYICEICVREAKGKLLCGEHYEAMKRRRRWLVIGSVSGTVLAVYLWLTFAPAVTSWVRHLYVDTTRVAIVFVGRDTGREVADYYIRMTTSQNPGQYHPGEKHNFRDIDGWFQREYERLSGRQTKVLEINTFGLYDLPGEVPWPSRSKTRSWEASKLDRQFRRYFTDLVRANEADVAKYQYLLFVDLTRDTGIPKDYIEQLGVTKNEIGYVRIPIHGEQRNDYYVMAVAHYVGRLLGASVKLDDHGYPLFPTGYAEPNLEPRYPQNGAELMGCYVPLRAFEIGRIESLDYVFIGSQSGLEMGWIPRVQRDAYYAAIRP
jgi:hypothetical protein